MRNDLIKLRNAMLRRRRVITQWRMGVFVAIGLTLGGLARSVPAETVLPQKNTQSPVFRIVSDCIGAPRSPKCTIETYLACFERRDPRLCAIVGVPDEPERAEQGLRLIGLEIPKEYSIDFFDADSNVDANSQYKRIFWVVRERYCLIRGDNCIALPWHQVIYRLFYNFNPVRPYTWDGLIIETRTVGAPASTLPSKIRRVDDVKGLNEIINCAKPNTPEYCAVTLLVACREQGFCQEYNGDGPFYRADYFARPDEYTEYRITGGRAAFATIHYDVRHCLRSERSCAGKEWVPRGATHSRRENNAWLARPADVPRLGYIPDT